MPRHKNLNAITTKQEIARWYEVELLSDAQIGKRLAERMGYEKPYSDVSIGKFRQKHRIESLTSRQKRDKEREGPSLDDLTPAVLRDFYAGMGDREIAKIYGVQKPAISRKRREWGIESLSKSERATSDEILSSEQKEAIIGSLLGDAFISRSGVFKVEHVYYQYEYLKGLHTLLRPLSRPLFYSEKTMKTTGVLTYSFGFRTRQHLWLKSMRKLFYPEEIKVFPQSILLNLAPRSLAYWYGDDGSLDSKLASFALGNFSVAEALRIIEAVNKRFELEAYLSPKSSETCKIMALRARSMPKFCDLISEFLTPDLLYKIPERYWPKGVIPRVRNKMADRIEVPTAIKKSNDVSEIVAFWKAHGFPFHVKKAKEIQVVSLLTPDQIIRDDRIRIRQTGQASCQAFMPHIWDAVNSGKSPRKKFEEDLEDIISELLQTGNPTPGRIRGWLRSKSLSGVYNFRPSAAKALVDSYCPEGGLVFDPCGGWGGRLFGTVLSSQCPRYVACEPSTETFKGLHALSQWMEEYTPGVSERVDLNCIPAEEFEPPEGIDVVLTSPPYWRRETYADEDTQSGVRYGTYSLWLEKFWKQVLIRSFEKLNPGGWMLLNVDNFIYERQEYNLVEDTMDICDSLGLRFDKKLRYEMPSQFKEDNCEWVLVYGKPGSQTYTKGKNLQVVFKRESQPSAGYEKQCEGCRVKFRAKRETRRFCSDNCAARQRRKKYRKKNPAKKFRLFTCRRCETKFEVPLKGGRPSLCPLCFAERDVGGRTKTCAYRECGRDFLDYSRQNSSKFCCVEHRRREKMFRDGKVTDVSQFRKPDPVLTRILFGQNSQRPLLEG